MLEIARFINSRFSSNTYVIAHPEHDDVWIVDPGDTDPIFVWMDDHSKKSVSGILLTHAHFDHIYGLNEILSHYPNCMVYIANEYGKEALRNPKLNGSKYTDEGPIEFEKGTSLNVYTNDMLLWCDSPLRVLYTPGHSDDSVCLVVNGVIFTGDTFIKDVRTVTKLKGGSIEKLEDSVKVLSELKGNSLMVMPGHGDAFKLDEYDLAKVSNNPINNRVYVSNNEA